MSLHFLWPEDPQRQTLQYISQEAEDENGSTLSASLGVTNRVKVFIVSPCKEPQVLLKVPRNVVRKGNKKGQGVVGGGTILGDKVFFCPGPLWEREPVANLEQVKAVKAGDRARN